MRRGSPQRNSELELRRLRIANQELNRYELEAKQEVLYSYPVCTVIPTGNRCNLRCIFCTERGSDAAQVYNDLSFEEFLQFTDPLGLASSVALYSWGEPLVNPCYQKVFDWVLRTYPGIQPYISTNGVLLDEKWAQKLVCCEGSIVNVSVNAASAGIYAQLTGRDCFQRVMGNIQKLRAMRNYGQYPLITMSFVAIKQNIEELPAFVELAGQLADWVLVQQLIVLENRHNALYLDFEDTSSTPYFIEAAQIARDSGIQIGFHPRVSCLPPLSDADNDCLWGDSYHQEQECTYPWDSFRVGINGDVLPCCYSQTIMGNLLNQGFWDIWNGEMYRYYRRTVNTESPPADCAVCPEMRGKKVKGGAQWR